MLESTELYPSTTCRTCLRSTNNVQSIFDKTSIDDTEIYISELFHLFTSIQVNKHDIFSNNICDKCLKELSRFYKFRQQCLKAEDLIQNALVIKETPVNGEIVYQFLRNEDDKVEGEVAIDEHSNDDSNIVWADDSKDDIMEDKSQVKERETSSRCSKKSRPPKGRHKNFECVVCCKRFTSTRLREHMRTHTKEKPFVCDVCGKGFAVKCNLDRHLKQHTGERPHKCHLCARGFIQPQSLVDHLKNHQERPYECEVCHRTFLEETDLTYHFRRHMNSDDPGSNRLYSCDVCGNSFETKGVLKTHQLTHGEKTFLCHDCGSKFYSKAGLTSHQKQHSQIKAYHCPICERSFTHLSSLKVHTLTHTGLRPFKCDVCRKTFAQTHHLKNHLRVHDGIKPYECKVCGKKLTLKGSLTVHMRIHTGETPHHCIVCNKGFYDTTSMKRHQMRHHIPYSSHKVT